MEDKASASLCFYAAATTEEGGEVEAANVTEISGQKPRMAPTLKAHANMTMRTHGTTALFSVTDVEETHSRVLWRC